MLIGCLSWKLQQLMWSNIWSDICFELSAAYLSMEPKFHDWM